MSGSTAEAGPTHAVTVLGDIRVEFRAHLGEESFRNILHDHLEFAPIELTVAGTAINFARHAVRRFSRVHVISRIGRDEFTERIQASLMRLGASSDLIVDEHAGNGTTILLRDPQAARLLVSGVPTPMARLSTADIAKCRTPIQQADLLVADGYLLLHEDSRKAVLAAARTASIARTRFCLDLVPHDIERYLSIRQVAVCVDKADIVISGARTVARLMSLPASYPYPADGIPPLARALGRYFHDRITWLLRFGDGDMDQVAVCRGGFVRSRYPTGYRECAEKTGFGDRIASTELSDLLRAGDR